MNILNEVDKPIVKKTVVVYAGRFQPFHKGHYAAYSKLVSKFGRNNVYIGTSDDTSGPKSPFNFNEKKHIATTMFGIPANRFIQIRNPYKPVEILKGFDGQTTQYIAAVGEKDATRLQGKYFKPYNGKAGYGYDEIGYVYPVPAEKDPISGTDVRNYLGGDDMEKAKAFFLKAYPKFNQKIFDMITDKIKSKQMQSLNEFGARTMGNGMAGDFGSSPVSKTDDEDVNEEGLPGGAFVGLVSPAGYIGGAPKPKDVKKLSKKLHKGDDEESHPKYVYDPIAELIGKKSADLIFNDFLSEYFGEDINTLSEKESKPNKNPIMDKDIKYKKASGEEGTIKVKDALRLKKDHPAHIQADKLLGAEKTTTKKDSTDTDDKSAEKQDPASDKGKEKQKPSADTGAEKQEPKKLSGDELKTDAEKSPEEKKSEEREKQFSDEYDKMPDEVDKEVAKEGNNPDSPIRKKLWDGIKNITSKGLNFLDKASKTIVAGVAMGVAPWLGWEGAKNVGNKVVDHVKNFVGKKFKQIKYFGKGLASLGKKTKNGERGFYGVIKDKDGKNVHYSDFQKKDENGNRVFRKEPVYKTGDKPKQGDKGSSYDKDTNQTKLFDKIDPESGYFTDGSGNLYDKKSRRVDKDGRLLDKDGKPIQKTSLRGKPKFTKHPVPADNISEEDMELFHKSIEEDHHQRHGVNHTCLEVGLIVGSIMTVGAVGGAVAAGKAGAGYSAIGQAALSGANPFAHGIGGFAAHFGKDLGKHAALELAGANTAIASGGATLHSLTGVLEERYNLLTERRNKLNELALLIENTKEGSNEQTLAAYNLMKNFHMQALNSLKDFKMSDEQMMKSMKKYNAMVKMKPKMDLLKLSKKAGINEVVSKTKVRNIADFVGYSMKRLKLKNKPNIKLILGNTYTEYNASLGGYSPDTKDIYVVVPKRMTADICRTIAHELVHRKQDEMGYIKDRNTAGKTGSPIENQANAVAGILLRDYGKINKEIYSEGLVLNEVSNMTGGNGSEDRPDGAFLPKGAARKLGSRDGYNNSDKWYTNGGYIQLEFPKADAIFGDEDQNKLVIQYTASNLPRQTGPQTKFTKNPDKAKLISEMGKGDIHFKAVFDFYRKGNAREKQMVAMLVTGNKYAKAKEIVKDLMEMEKEDIEYVENRLGISPFDETKKEVYGGEPGGWYGAGAKRSVDGWIDDNDNDYTDLSKTEDININVNPGDEVLMGKFKNKKVKVKDIGKDQHGMPTINGKQATTFRTVNEGNYIAGGMQDDQSFRSPYTDKWERFDDRAQTHAEIVGYTVIGHTSDSYPQKKKGVVMPSKNPSEENGPGKRWIHPSKGEDYANEKKEKWEMYPFNSRPQAYKPPPAVGTQIDIFKYTKPSVIKENIEEWNQLLLEGGAYGHMSHPFDDMDLTFGDLKDIITKALDGELGVVREKTDGQALAISWKNGRLIAARNKGHLQNAGANAMGIEDVASKFAGRGGLTDAYNYAMRDLSAAISGLSDKQRDKIFQQGKCFMNLEVIWPTSVNVIPYGQALLIFHNITCYDESGKAIAADQSAARTLAGMIKQVNADVQSKYTIQGPPVTSIPKNQNLIAKKSQYLSKLSKLQNEFGLSDSDTVALYHQSWWENFIDKNAPIKVDTITKEALVKRWAFGDKSFRLNTISNEELVKWAIDTDKVNVAKQQKENIKPFEEIFLGVGADILEFVSSVLTVAPDKAVRSMKDRLKSTADQVRKAGSPSQIQKLKTELERLNNLGGVERIVPVEGLVFFYNDKTYKLTGTFAPLNQILGIFYG